MFLLVILISIPVFAGHSRSLPAGVASECGTPAQILHETRLRRLGQAVHDGRPWYLNESVENTDFRVWFTSDTRNFPTGAITPAQAQVVLDFATRVKQLHVGTWGYIEPASNGADRYEIYVFELASGVSGLTFDLHEESPANTSRISINARLVRGALGTPVDAKDYGDESRLIGILGHEYHHAQQNAYIFTPCSTCPVSRLWLNEGSGAWMEYQTRLQFPDIIGGGNWKQYRRRIEFFTRQGWRGLLSLFPDSGVFEDWYDGALFFYFLGNNTRLDFHGAGPPPIALEQRFWEALSARDDWFAWREVFDSVLAEADVNGYSTFGEAFAHFAEALVHPEDWAPWPDDSVTADTRFRTPDENDAQDLTVEVDLENSTFPLTLTSAVDADPHSVAAYGVFYVEFEPGDRAHRMTLQFDGDDATAFEVRVIRPFRRPALGREWITLGAARNGTRQVRVDPVCDESVYLAIINTDTTGTGAYSLTVRDVQSFARGRFGYCHAGSSADGGGCATHAVSHRADYGLVVVMLALAFRRRKRASYA